MLPVVLNIAFALVVVASALGFWRLLVGPSVPDRILALDTLAITIIALLILVGIRLGTSLFFEVALLIALIGFVSTVALCKYLLHGDIID